MHVQTIRVNLAELGRFMLVAGLVASYVEMVIAVVVRLSAPKLGYPRPEPSSSAATVP